MEVRFKPQPVEMADDAPPPSEFRIWKFGENDTLNGKVSLDEESAAAVMKAFSEHGIELAIDYEHGTFEAPKGQPVPAAGWFTPEVRADGLWATKVRWTDDAANMLKARKYRYFSPTALIDKATRKPHKLMPMALTNWPATKNIEPLMARADQPTNGATSMNTVLVALGLKADADEAEAFAAANKLRDIEREIFAVTGAKDSATAIGALHGLKKKADSADEATKALEAFKAEQSAAETKSYIDSLVTDGKVEPAKRSEIEALAAKVGLDGLKAFGALLPKQVGRADGVKPAKPMTREQRQLVEIKKYKADNKDASTADAYVACAMANPELFDESGAVSEEE